MYSLKTEDHGKWPFLAQGGDGSLRASDSALDFKQSSREVTARLTRLLMHGSQAGNSHFFQSFGHTWVQFVCCGISSTRCLKQRATPSAAVVSGCFAPVHCSSLFSANVVVLKRGEVATLLLWNVCVLPSSTA